MTFQKKCVRKSSSGSRSIGKGWEARILSSCENPRSVRKSEWDEKMRKIYCFISCIMGWDDMRYETSYRMRYKLFIMGSPEYILPVTPSISATPVSLYTPVTQSVSIISVSPYSSRSWVLCQTEWRWLWETDCPATTSPSPLWADHTSPLPYNHIRKPKRT